MADIESYMPRAGKIITRFLERHPGWRYLEDDIRGEVNLRIVKAWEKVNKQAAEKQIFAFLDRAVQFGIRDAIRQNGGSTGRYRKNELTRVPFEVLE